VVVNRYIHTNMAGAAQGGPWAGLQGSHEVAFLPDAREFGHDDDTSSQNNNDKGHEET
jgi:hypothetical protein